jgi:hypothetical protein
MRGANGAFIGGAIKVYSITEPRLLQDAPEYSRDKLNKAAWINWIIVVGLHAV